MKKNIIAIIDCPPLARWVPSMDASLHTRGVIIDVSTDANGIIVLKVKLDCQEYGGDLWLSMGPDYSEEMEHAVVCNTKTIELVEVFP